MRGLFLHNEILALFLSSPHLKFTIKNSHFSDCQSSGNKEFTENPTPLSVDFLNTAQNILNVPQKFWYSCDSLEVKYEFVEKTCIPIVKHLLEVQRNLLRSEEDENLTIPQKQEFSEVLANNIDVLSEGETRKQDLPSTKLTLVITLHCQFLFIHLVEKNKESLKNEINSLLEKNIIEEVQPGCSGAKT